MDLLDSFEPLTESQVTEAERLLGRNIPAAYRAFLLQHNGGKPNRTEFSFVNDDEEEELCSIKFFLGLNPTIRSLGIDYALDMFDGEMPSSIFPVARDPGGNFICIDTSPETEGHVVFWDHEVPPPGKNVFFVAPSFETFLSRLI